MKLFSLILFAIYLGVISGAGAQDEPEPASVAAKYLDPSIPLDQFTLMLIPLTASELGQLAENWQEIVKARTETVVAAKLQTYDTDGADTRPDILALTADRNAQFAKLGAVLNQWEQKGGNSDDIATYRAYRSGVISAEQRSTSLQGLSQQALHWLKSRDGGVTFAINAGIAAAALLALLIIAGIIRGAARRVLGRVPDMSRLMENFLAKVVYWLAITVGLLITFSALGIDVTPIFAVIGGASFIIAFAMQNTLGNLAAGLMIMINRPFDVGDYVEIAGVAGTVQSVSIVTTTITTPDNQIILVPNTSVWGDVITNVSASDLRRVDMIFGIGYDDSIEEAEKILRETCLAHPKVLADPAPAIGVNELGASSVDLFCRPWCRNADYWSVKWDLTREMKLKLDEAGISIPYPQTDMHIHMQSAGKPEEGTALLGPLAPQ